MGSCDSFHLVKGVLRCNQTCTKKTCNDDIWINNNEDVMVMVRSSLFLFSLSSLTHTHTHTYRLEQNDAQNLRGTPKHI